MVVFVTGKPTVIKDKQLHESHMRVPFSCRNSANPIAVLLTFSHNNRPVHAVDPKYGGKTGELELLRYMPCLENGEMSADLPSITTTEKKMKGSAFFVSSDGTMLETIKNFNVELPK